jgi:hypothetical protein
MCKKMLPGILRHDTVEISTKARFLHVTVRTYGYMTGSFSHYEAALCLSDQLSSQQLATQSIYPSVLVSIDLHLSYITGCVTLS